MTTLTNYRPTTRLRVVERTEAPAAIFTTASLNVWYGDTHALKNIDLTIFQNEVTAIIGPSGCGKSTYLKTLNRMVETNPAVRISGSAQFKEIDLLNATVERLRSEVGMVFQKPNPFPKSIYDNVAYGPKLHGIRKKAMLDEIVENSLKKAALWDEVKDRLSASAFGLSGGQQQRLCIARSLAIEPSVLLMDEPTSALDPVSTNKVEELIGELKKDVSIVIVTHNMQQAARISDRTAFFLHGEVVEYDRTEAIFERPSSRLTDDYVNGRFG